MRAAPQKTRREERGHGLRPDRSVADPSVRRLDLDEGLEPEGAPRAGAHELDRFAARRGAGNEGLGNLVRAGSSGRAVPSEKDARRIPLLLAHARRPRVRQRAAFSRGAQAGGIVEQEIESRGRHLPVQPTVDADGGGASAQAETIDRQETRTSVGRANHSLATASPETRPGEYFLAADRLARLGAADFDDPAAERFAAKIRVVCDDAVDLGPR